MKRIKLKSVILLLTAGALLGVSSCKKYLEVESDSNTSQNVVFESLSYTNSAIIGVYNKLCGDNGYGSRISTLFPMTADDFKTSGSYAAADRRGISMYGASSDNSDLYTPFVQLYSGIERANICIKYIPASSLYNTGTESEKASMRTYYGEALALRAQFYYELIRNWGDVPAPFIPAADAESLYYSNANRDETYDRILEDLKTAEELVPWRSESSYGSFRFTKGAIKGLRARIALARGGYSLRSDTHLMERRSDYLKYYQIAYDECKDVMSRRSEHTLNPVFENVFKSLHSITRYDDQHELMFEIGSYGSNSRTDSKLGYYNGIKFDGSTFGTTSGGVNAIATYFYEFDRNDSRRDVTIGSYEINTSNQKILRTATNMTDAKFRKSWTAFDGTSSSQNFAINWPILRFADILLMFAEADNEINNGPSAEAVSALTEVRARAFSAHPESIPSVATDKAGFFNDIVKERLLEFGGEGMRKYDLVRWNLIASKFAETRVKLTQFMNGEGTYANLPANIYAKGSTYNRTTSAAEVESLDLYGGTASAIFYQPSTTTTTPSGYTAKTWRSAVNDAYINGASSGFATYFEANKKELFPYPKSALNENYNMVQNFGY